MKILGFRSDPKSPRFALVKQIDDAFVLVNKDSESRLRFPAGSSDIIEKIYWLSEEFVGIFNEHPDIEKVVIKSGEFTRFDNQAKRNSSYQEASLLMCCKQQNVEAFIKIYQSLSTSSRTVLTDAEQRVEATSSYWDAKMADAVIAAHWGFSG